MSATNGPISWFRCGRERFYGFAAFTALEIAVAKSPDVTSADGMPFLQKYFLVMLHSEQLGVRQTITRG